MTFTHSVLVIATLLAALVAGLLFAYACSVNPGLGRLPDEKYLAAMQSINRAIQNPVFFLAFMGALILLPVSAWLQYRAGAGMGFRLVLLAAILYAIGVFGVTMAGNVPLNNALDRFDLSSANAEELAQMRRRFQIPWNNLHLIRTIASIISALLMIIACLKTTPKDL